MDISEKLNTTCLFILTVIALAFVFATAKVVLIPFTLAIFISLVYSPFIHLLERKIKLPRILILGSSFGILVLGILLITAIVGNSIDSFVQGADQYKERLHDLSVKATELLENFGYSTDKENLKKIFLSFPVGKFIKSISGSMLGVLSNTFLVVFFTLFLLTGESINKKKNAIIEEIKKNAGSYIQTKLITSGLTSLITYIVLMIFNVEMAFMFAILTFLLNFIPNIGSIVAVALPLPIVLLQFGLGYQIIIIFALLITAQTIIGNILEPKLLGDSMGLHPVTVLLFLTFWGYIWGVIGMFLSVPITATLKIVFEKFEFTKPIAKIFSGELN